MVLSMLHLNVPKTVFLKIKLRGEVNNCQNVTFVWAITLPKCNV